MQSIKLIMRRILHRPHPVACLGVDVDFSMRQAASHPQERLDPRRPYGDLLDLTFTDKNDVPIESSRFEWSRN